MTKPIEEQTLVERLRIRRWYGMIGNNTKRKSVQEGKPDRIADLLEESAKGFDYIEDCFNAAFAEGLYEVLQETTDERLKDLVERRLMYAYYFIKDGSKVE